VSFTLCYLTLYAYTAPGSLLAASTAYLHALSKKQDCSQFLDDPAESLPMDALGMVMILHGEDFPDNSAFGNPSIHEILSHFSADSDE
jgi:hypothetical protein